MYSVIVPIYKIEKYLPQCVDSILAQTHGDFELILVDDGSPDSCPQICDEYAARDTRIKVVHKPNGGLVSARKAGVAVATGDYVCFVDGDDFVERDMLFTYERVLQKQDVDVICTGFSAYYEDKVIPANQKIPFGFYEKEALEAVYGKMLSVEPFYTFYIYPAVWAKCFRKEILDRVYREVPDDITLGEDVAVTYPAILAAKSVYVVDYSGYMYRQNPNSMTHTYDKNLYEKVKNLLVYLYEMVEREHWNGQQQIDEYAVFLLTLAKNNELNFNNQDPYRIKKQKLYRYLKDRVFISAMKNVKMKTGKNRFLLFCMRNKWVFPIYLYGKRNS